MSHRHPTHGHRPDLSRDLALAPDLLFDLSDDYLARHLFNCAPITVQRERLRRGLVRRVGRPRQRKEATAS